MCFYKIQDILTKKLNIFCFFLLELPKSRPKINGGLLDNNYKPGDTLNLTCISAPSNPPATLEWRLNGDLVSYYSYSIVHLDNFYNEMLSLRIMVYTYISHYRLSRIRLFRSICLIKRKVFFHLSLGSLCY